MLIKNNLAQKKIQVSWEVIRLPTSLQYRSCRAGIPS